MPSSVTNSLQSSTPYLFYDADHRQAMVIRGRNEVYSNYLTKQLAVNEKNETRPSRAWEYLAKQLTTLVTD